MKDQIKDKNQNWNKQTKNDSAEKRDQKGAPNLNTNKVGGADTDFQKNKTTSGYGSSDRDSDLGSTSSKIDRR